MSRRTNLWSLIVAQLVCTALGLWMQQWYTTEELQNALQASGAVATSAAAIQVVEALDPAFFGIRLMTFVWTNGLSAIIVYMIVSRVHDEFSQRGTQPAVEALRRTTDLLRTQDAVIFGLARLADSRDPETGDHLERISYYSSTLASAIRRRGMFRDEVTEAFVQNIGTSSALHDIGKVGVEDAILHKPGPLTPRERERMQEHTRIGEQCLKEIERRLGSSNFLRMAREIAAAHHERWDGQGYPNRLSAKEIPLAARIVAIADAYDAMATKRVYKEAMPHVECVDEIRREAGRQFDPQLVEIFLEVEPAFKDIAERFGRSVSPTDRILEDINRSLPTIASEQGGPAFHKEVTRCCETASPGCEKI